MRSLQKIFALGTLLLPVAFVTLNTIPFQGKNIVPSSGNLFVMTARADDNENENESENDDNYKSSKSTSSSSSSSAQTKTIKVIKNVIVYKPVTETIVVTEEAYTKDTDGDLLVDAIDPDPLIKQSEYFTDIDGDGVPNALDKHHDEDDFSYYDFETDDNNNGILDSYEQ